MMPAKPARFRLMALVLALGLGASACTADPIPTTTWQTSNAELERAARAGYPAKILFVPTGTEAEARRQYAAPARRLALIIIGETDVFVLPAPGSPFLAQPAERQAFVARWVMPYVGQLDFDGAVRTTARGYCRELEERGLLPRLPPSPPIGLPNRWAYRFPSRNWDWGLPVALLVALLAGGISQLTLRRRPQAMTPKPQIPPSESP